MVAVIVLRVEPSSVSHRDVITGMLLGHIRPSRPPGTVAESATSAPEGGATTLLVPSAFWTMPICRLVLPVTTVVLPSLMEPPAEVETTHCGVLSKPSAASIAGASTGQRVKGAHSPFSTGSAAVAVPREAKAPSAVRAETVAILVRVVSRGMGGGLPWRREGERLSVRGRGSRTAAGRGCTGAR